MKSGLLAPQYGVVCKQLVLSVAELAPVPTVDPALDAVGAPKVVIKRRRQIDAEGPSGSSADPSIEPRAPRVFRVEAPAPANTAPATAEAPVPVPAIETPGSDKSRRRRDPLRAPRLVQHIVFEPDADRSGGSLAEEADTRVDAKKLRSALDALDAKLQAAAQAQASYRALDDMLTRLGLPNKSA